MKILIVFSHPEPASFSAALKDEAVASLTALGHDVRVSDLYALGFAAAGGAADFLHACAPPPFNYQSEQRRAHAESSYAHDIAAEHEKLLWCDTLMLNFPLWWFGPPAILKGWIDRVMSVGFAYDSDRRFENGALAGRQAMVTITTGSPAERFSRDGVHAYAPVDDMLRPLNGGLFPYVGMSALPTFVAYAVARQTPEARAQLLSDYRVHLTATLG